MSNVLYNELLIMLIGINFNGVAAGTIWVSKQYRCGKKVMFPVIVICACFASMILTFFTVAQHGMLKGEYWQILLHLLALNIIAASILGWCWSAIFYWLQHKNKQNSHKKIWLVLTYLGISSGLIWMIYLLAFYFVYALFEHNFRLIVIAGAALVLLASDFILIIRMKKSIEHRLLKTAAHIVILLAMVALSVFCSYDTSYRGAAQPLSFSMSYFRKENNINSIQLNPPVSAELVSQEKPLVFFPEFEEPKIEGIKVKLTYEDGKSKVVDAYQAKESYIDHDAGGDSYSIHWKGMGFGMDADYSDRPVLKAGKQKLAMFCGDLLYSSIQGEWTTGPISYAVDPKETGVAYCMVDVYVQTLEEYLATHTALTTTITETKSGTIAFNKGENGIINLLSQEDGVYEVITKGKYDFDPDPELHECLGNGILLNGVVDNDLTMSQYFAILKANEPLYLKFSVPDEMKKVSVQLSMTRLPEVEIAVGESIQIKQPVSLRIKDYDRKNDGSQRENQKEGDYIFAGEGYDHFSPNNNNFNYDTLYLKTDSSFVCQKTPPIHYAYDGEVIVPHPGKASIVSLRFRDSLIPQKEIQLKTNEYVLLFDHITTDFRSDTKVVVDPNDVIALECKAEGLYLHALKKGKTTLTLSEIRLNESSSNSVLGSIEVVVK